YQSSTDPVLDPHAESRNTNNSSSPNTQPTTQYAARLKIVKLPDVYGHSKLVIGVAGYNYLITAGIIDDKEAAINQSMYSSLRCLAQVRSSFGNITIYMPRRSAMNGYSSPEYMSITIFTLAENNVRFGKLFYKIATRVQQKGLSKKSVSLKLCDIEIPLENDSTDIAQATRGIIDLFGDESRLTITGNSELESALTKLASLLASIISDKNRMVARSIMNQN
ncbi:hypothetical protein BGZ76_006080, partial [Entomortierella beljakovae]